MNDIRRLGVIIWQEFFVSVHDLRKMSFPRHQISVLFVPRCSYWKGQHSDFFSKSEVYSEYYSDYLSFTLDSSGIENICEGLQKC